MSRQYLRLDPSSTGFAEMYRRDEAQRLEARARSVLRDFRIEGPLESPEGVISCGIATRKAEKRTFALARGAEKVKGFLALPRDPNRHRAIIVIHEWWGLNRWVKEQAEKLAANGYVALAVDLYQGKVTADPSEARTLKRSLREDRAIRDLKAAFDYLARRPDVDPKHIGTLGWSMGGGLALQLAIHEPRLAACVVHYGALPAKLADIRKINAPVLGIFGSLDRGITPGQVRAFESCMKVAGKRVDIEIYAGAGHAFESPANKRGYRPETAAVAWVRTLEFFEHAKES